MSSGVHLLISASVKMLPYFKTVKIQYNVGKPVDTNRMFRRQSLKRLQIDQRRLFSKEPHEQDIMRIDLETILWPESC